MTVRTHIHTLRSESFFPQAAFELSAGIYADNNADNKEKKMQSVRAE